MIIKKLAACAVVFVSILLSGCAGDLAKVQAIYTLATTTTVSADVVRPAANAFDILKGTAANFAKYCVQNNNTPSICDVGTRRAVSQAIKTGTQARVQLRASLATGQPALATVYNVLVTAVNNLKATPAATFTGG
jgi:hypothetical protein